MKTRMGTTFAVWILMGSIGFGAEKEEKEGKNPVAAKTLSISLETDAKAVGPGETIKLTTVITNNSKKALNLYVGYSTTGVDFESGTALRLIEVTSTCFTHRHKHLCALVLWICDQYVF